MSASGKRGVLTFVDYGNWASLNTHRRFGFVPTSTVFVLKVLGKSFFSHREPAVTTASDSAIATRRA